MRWHAMLGADVGVILVKPDSPHTALEALLEAVKGRPSFGGPVVACRPHLEPSHQLLVDVADDQRFSDEV